MGKFVRRMWRVLASVTGCVVKLHAGLVEARFVERVNRFVVRVNLDGRDVQAHLPNTGRMTELLVPGAAVWLTPAPPNQGRKTAYDLTLVGYADTLVSVDSRLPNAVFREAVEAGVLAGFEGYSVERAEVLLGDSRIDLLLSGNEGLCYVETKSVNLVVDGRALFPDAPTERGRRHLGELAAAVAAGHRACAVFVVQRGDAVEMAPYREADELFGEALDRAVELGVEAKAYRCRVTTEEVAIEGSIPVRLGPVR